MCDTTTYCLRAHISEGKKTCIAMINAKFRAARTSGVGGKVLESGGAGGPSAHLERWMS